MHLAFEILINQSQFKKTFCQSLCVNQNYIGNNWKKYIRRIQILAGELSLSAVTVVAVVDEEPASKRRKDNSLGGRGGGVINPPEICGLRKRTERYYISPPEFENLTRALKKQKKKKCALSKVKIHIKGYTVVGSTKFRQKIGGRFVS